MITIFRRIKNVNILSRVFDLCQNKCVQWCEGGQTKQRLQESKAAGPPKSEITKNKFNKYAV